MWQVYSVIPLSCWRGSASLKANNSRGNELVYVPCGDVNNSWDLCNSHMMRPYICMLNIVSPGVLAWLLMKHLINLYYIHIISWRSRPHRHWERQFVGFECGFSLILILCPWDGKHIWWTLNLQGDKVNITDYSCNKSSTQQYLQLEAVILFSCTQKTIEVSQFLFGTVVL